MSQTHYIPCPVFDTLPELIEQYKACYASDNPRQEMQKWLAHCFIANKKIQLPDFATRDFQWALSFLYSYRGSADTFSAYRRDIERILQWSWFVRQQSVAEHSREDIESFIAFCIDPPKGWVGHAHAKRFIDADTGKEPNPKWRPFFHAKSTKKSSKVDAQYQFSQQALKVMFGILSSFFKFLLQDGIVTNNPVSLIRQKSKFIRTESSEIIRRLSDQQWQMVIQLTEQAAKQDPTQARSVFILSCLYSMYLRISELVCTSRWAPCMSDFYQDIDGYWWFKTVGKGNKARQVAVSEAMLSALKNYREDYLGLAPYPTPDEKVPLVGHVGNPNRPLTSTRQIRRLVQQCFDRAAEALALQGETHEANLLRAATVHWLRHTGISDDVKSRPREHVRDDAGHSSGAITDRYIDVHKQERAQSAQSKPIKKSSKT